MAKDERLLGKYRIDHELGRGGFATVYRARDTTLNRDVALKVLDPLLMRDTGWVAQFHREARTIGALVHPRILTIYEVNEADGRLYLAMALAEGGSLADEIKRRGRLPWHETLARLAPICDALDYAHSRGVVHRDLKPANILLDGARQTLLSDFGFARLLSDNSASQTLSGGILGTPAYVAPEVWDQDAVTPAVDIYALGCIVYETLTGTPLFPGRTPMQVMVAHSRGPRYAAGWPDDAPAGVRTILDRALARSPADRHPGAAALYHELQALQPPAQAPDRSAGRSAAAAGMSALGDNDRETTAHPEPAARARAGRRWWPAVAGLVVISGIVLWMLLGRNHKETHPPVITALPPTSTQSRPPEAESNPNAKNDSDDSGLVTPMQTPTATWSPSPSPTLTPSPTSTLEPTETPTETATPTPPAIEPGAQRVRARDGMVMRYVPPGSFMMGTSRDHPHADKDEFPLHRVTLSGFWIDQTEVTNAHFSVFLNAQGNRTEGSGTWLDINSGDSRITWVGGAFRPREGYTNHPVVEVTWYGARAYCAWAGGRLPTEAEWQYAAGGPDSREYPWGNTHPNCSLAQFRECGGQTIPVGSKPAGASWIGALDVAGNVWEWTADWYHDEYYAVSPAVDPTGPANGTLKMLCGGSWGHPAPILRVADRNYHPPTHSDYVIGFRCAGSQQ